MEGQTGRPERGACPSAAGDFRAEGRLGTRGYRAGEAGSRQTVEPAARRRRPPSAESHLLMTLFGQVGSAAPSPAVGRFSSLPIIFPLRPGAPSVYIGVRPLCRFGNISVSPSTALSSYHACITSSIVTLAHICAPALRRFCIEYY